MSISVGVALMAAQLLAGIGVNGVNLGKRDVASGVMISNLLENANSLLVNQVKPIVENALNGLSLRS